MKTLYTLILTTALASTLQVASATPYVELGTYGTTYSGYWRTHDGHGGWTKDDNQMRVPHGVNNWNDCFYECKDDSNCKGIEFQSKRHGHNVCEIHYDPFAHCEQKSGSHGNNSNRSTCWVKTEPPMHDYDNYDMSDRQEAVRDDRQWLIDLADRSADQ